MNHLTTQELFELADNRIDHVRKARLNAHLTACDRCSRAVALERSLRHVVKNAPIVKSPDGLTALIMANLSTHTSDSLLLNLLGKLGSFVAMAVVLGVVGFVIMTVSNANVQSSNPSTPLKEVISPITELYVQGIDALNSRTAAITHAIDSTSGHQVWNTIYFILLTFGALAAADKVFGKRLTKLRS